MQGDVVNLAAQLSASAARLPVKPALLHRGAATSYAELEARVARGAAALVALGLSPHQGAAPGDRVALMLDNSPAFVEACFAVLRAGLVAVPLNPGFTRDEVGAIVADSGARAAIVAEPHLAALHPRAADAAGLEHVLVPGVDDPPDEHLSWERLVAETDPGAVAEAGPDALAVLGYTSGTTGQAKGAMLSHANLAANHRQLAQTRLRIEESDVVLGVLPLSHIYGLNVVMAFALARGATLLLQERFDPGETLDAVERQRVTVLVGAPPMYVAWGHMPGAAERDLASVRFAVSGAAPLPAHALEHCRDVLGITVWEGYGLTETGPVLTTMAMSEQPKPGCVGRPVPEVGLRLVDDDGEPVRRGDPGEVVVRGPNVFSGYWQRPEETAAVLDRAGWFRTGDVGYADDDGDLHLVDRKRDLILVSGFNVYPREVEEVLVRHPGVAQAAVVGAPNPATGECVQAFVVPAGGAALTADELTAFARRHLARFKVPEHVEFVDALPLLPTGKVRRRALRGTRAGGL